MTRRPFRVPAHSDVGLIALLLALSLPSPSGAQSMDNVHRDSGGTPADAAVDLNGAPVLSDDGRHVAFASDATNLVAGDTNGLTDVFVHDRLLGVTVIVSLDAAGGPADGISLRPALSGSGRFVVFQSSATDLVAGDTNALPDVFRHDRDTDADGIFDEPGFTATTRVSVSGAGAQGTGASRSYSWAVSDDGNVIAFESDAANLVPGDTNGATDCFVRNVSAGTTTRVSVGGGGVQANGGTGDPGISGDGLSVVFSSGTLPSNLVAGDTNLLGDVFVRRLPLGPTLRVSVATGGAQSVTGASSSGRISDDGNRVAFMSTASDLSAGDSNDASDVFLRDILAGTTARVSVSTGGYQAGVSSTSPALSGDGLAVAWVAEDEFVTGDTNGSPDVYIRDLGAGGTTRASRAANGTQGNGPSLSPSLSDDGSCVAFLSTATTLVPSDLNGVADAFVRCGPFLGPNLGYGGIAMVDENPVSFSVNGPVDPNTEGIRDPRGGGGFSAQVPFQPGNPVGFGIRVPAVPQAEGIPTPRPGDVYDYDTPPPIPPGGVPLPSEAVIFQSPAIPVGILAFPGAPAPPDGTNNQFVESIASGLVSGPGVPPPSWTALPPMEVERDNIDALSFGQDYFPPMMMVSPLGLPLPTPTPWRFRASFYPEPLVTDDYPGVSFRFSVDPWAIGAAGSAVSTESGGADVGAGIGPWSSPGEAAGDVFATPSLARVGGVTYGGGGNLLTHDQAALGLAAPLDPQEDDLDALECVGANEEWPPGGFVLRSGNIHERMIHVGPPSLAPRGASWHEPYNHTPYFFSVTRNSPGAAGTAVRSQFVIDGGAAADVFIAVKDPAEPLGDGTNLLFCDNNELGLYAMSDPTTPYPSPADSTDDLDALLVWVCPEYRGMIITAIDEILGILPPPGGGAAGYGGAAGWVPGVAGSYFGGGMTISVTKYLFGTGRPIPLDCIRIAFSVTTDAIGLEYTGVDWEAGPVGAPGGVSSVAGDVYFANITGAAVNRNWLWYQAEDLGLDGGSWVNNSLPDRSLEELSDNLNALDSTEPMPPVGVAPRAPDGPADGLGLIASPNPFHTGARIAFVLPRPGRVRLSVHDVTGRTLAVLSDGAREAGGHAISWNGRDASGARAPAGVYFVRALYEGRSHVGRMVKIE